MAEGFKKNFFEILCVVLLFGVLLFIGCQNQNQTIQNDTEMAKYAQLKETDKQKVAIAKRLGFKLFEKEVDNYIATINAKNLDYQAVDFKDLEITSYDNGTSFSCPIRSDKICEVKKADDGNSFVVHTKDEGKTAFSFVYYKDDDGRLRVKPAADGLSFVYFYF